MMGREDISGEWSDGVTPRMRHIRRTRTMNHRRGLEPCDRFTDLRRIEQVDTLPPRKPRDFLGRRRMVRPADDILTSPERLDDVAAGKTGGARDKNHALNGHYRPYCA